MKMDPFSSLLTVYHLLIHLSVSFYLSSLLYCNFTSTACPVYNFFKQKIKIWTRDPLRRIDPPYIQWEFNLDPSCVYTTLWEVTSHCRWVTAGCQEWSDPQPQHCHSCRHSGLCKLRDSHSHSIDICFCFLTSSWVFSRFLVHSFVHFTSFFDFLTYFHYTGGIFYFHFK